MAPATNLTPFDNFEFFANICPQGLKPPNGAGLAAAPGYPDLGIDGSSWSALKMIKP
jgi:hypothetical protein